MTRVLRFFGALLLVGALAGGGYWLYRSRGGAAGDTATGTYTQIVTVTRGDLRSAVTVVGELAAVQSADLTFARLSGTAPLLTLDIQPGNTVTAGQVLAAVDPAPSQQALDQARSDLQAAEKKLADLATPTTALDIARADLAIARAELQVQQAQNTLADLLQPDIAALRVAAADAQVALAQARADLLAQQDNAAAAEQLARLKDVEATAAAEHARLARETYSDVYHQDRLLVAFNEMLDAADARITAETQAQVAALRAQMQVRKAERTLADAQAALRDAQAANDPTSSAGLKLARARLDVRDAEVALLAAREARAKLDAGPEAATLAAAQTDVARKRLAVADAEAALTGATLRAPFAGTVLEVPVAAGDGVTANTNIATIADLGRLRVVASVDETTIRRVAAGQTAEVTFDALPGQALAGVVESVPLQGKLQGGVTVYQVPVALADTAGLPLLVGLTANVAVQTGQVTDALLVPALALQKVGGMYQVQVPNTVDPAGAAETVPVEVGLSDGTYTQVLRGLNEGDQVIVTLSEGDDMFGFGFMRSSRPPRGP